MTRASHDNRHLLQLLQLTRLFVSDAMLFELLENNGELIELVKCVSKVIIDLTNFKEQGFNLNKLDENLLLCVKQPEAK